LSKFTWTFGLDIKSRKSVSELIVSLGSDVIRIFILVFSVMPKPEDVVLKMNSSSIDTAHEKECSDCRGFSQGKTVVKSMNTNTISIQKIGTTSNFNMCVFVLPPNKLEHHC